MYPLWIKLQVIFLIAFFDGNNGSAYQIHHQELYPVDSGTYVAYEASIMSLCRAGL